MDTQDAAPLSIAFLVLASASLLVSLGFGLAFARKPHSRLLHAGTYWSFGVFAIICFGCTVPLLWYAYEGNSDDLQVADDAENSLGNAQSAQVVMSREPIGESPSGVFAELNRTLDTEIDFPQRKQVLVGYAPFVDRVVARGRSWPYSSPEAAVLRYFMFGDLGQHPQQTPGYYESKEFQKRRLQYHAAFERRFSISPEILAKVDGFIPPNTIGLHIRYTGHFRSDSLKTLDGLMAVFIREVRRHKFEKIFVATILEDALDTMRKEFGQENVLSYEQHLRKGNVDWVGTGKGDAVERMNVAIDWLLLSKCTRLIGGPSNIFLATLWKNPSMAFSIPPELKDVGAN